MISPRRRRLASQIRLAFVAAVVVYGGFLLFLIQADRNHYEGAFGLDADLRGLERVSEAAVVFFVPVLLVLQGVYYTYFRQELAREYEERVARHSWLQRLQLGDARGARYYVFWGGASILVGLVFLALYLFTF